MRKDQTCGTKEQLRGDRHASRLTTRICYEQATPHNPFLAEKLYCHGYELLDLMSHGRFVDVLYLLFRGELPSRQQAGLLEQLMIAMINPGPRHPATRAAVYAAVGKTNTAHILPLALNVLSGYHQGGSEVAASIRFIERHQDLPPKNLAHELLTRMDTTVAGDRCAAPGFGSLFGNIDPVATRIADHLLNMEGCGPKLQWGQHLALGLAQGHMGWLRTGIAAAVFSDLGFSWQAGAGLFQLISAPGLLAHGIEMVDKPIQALPFLDEQHYIIHESAKKPPVYN